MKEISEIFNNFAVGLGAILAGLGGFIAFWEWSKNRVNLNKFKNIRNNYPREKLVKTDGGDGTFLLLRNPGNGHIFIYDLVAKERFFIKNWSTFKELGYYDNDWKNISEEESTKYKDYKSGEDIIAP